mmetsp:Transcript_34018/g.97244  ORF Transcript_34018/g.97244 Transcript_34018/m.97244 type:complete len:257 (-) Transcript_34018:2428-3198(-)
MLRILLAVGLIVDGLPEVHLLVARDGWSLHRPGVRVLRGDEKQHQANVFAAPERHCGAVLGRPAWEREERLLDLAEVHAAAVELHLLIQAAQDNELAVRLAEDAHVPCQHDLLPAQSVACELAAPARGVLHELLLRQPLGVEVAGPGKHGSGEGNLALDAAQRGGAPHHLGLAVGTALRRTGILRRWPRQDQGLTVGRVVVAKPAARNVGQISGHRGQLDLFERLEDCPLREAVAVDEPAATLEQEPGELRGQRLP